MNLRQNIITNNLITLSGFIILIIIAFIIAKSDLQKSVFSNLELITKTMYETSILYSKKNIKGYEEEEFKNFVKNVKIGENGYIYFIDLEGKIVIHPKYEGKNVWLN